MKRLPGDEVIIKLRWRCSTECSVSKLMSGYSCAQDELNELVKFHTHTDMFYMVFSLILG